MWISGLHTIYFPFFCHGWSLELTSWLAFEEDAASPKKIKWNLTLWLLAVTGWGAWKNVSFTPSCENKCLDGWVTAEGAEKKWKWVDRGREIWCICLKLRPIRFCTNSGGALFLAFGQFMIAYTSHLGQKQNIKAIWKSISLKQPVKLGDHPSNSWFVAALVFHSTSVYIMWDYSPITLLPGMHIKSKIKGTMHKPF